MGNHCLTTIPDATSIQFTGRSWNFYFHGFGRARTFAPIFFVCFFIGTPGDLQTFQQNILTTETETAIKTAQGSIEHVEFKNDFATMLLLLPLQTDLQPLFAGIIDECNQYGNFLHENMIITNVKKLSEEEIYQLLRNKNQNTEIT